VSEPEKDDFRRTPAPRQKVEIRLTATQAEKLRGLWEEHSGPLHAMLVGWCGDPQNASDVLQEVFRRLAGSPGLMEKMNNARAFLAVSARRVAVDFARRGATRVAYHTAAGTETPASENPGPTDENLRAVIAKALDGLPAEQRSVFEHKILNGRTLDEISRLEGVSLNTAASRLRYALDKIRGQLRPYYDDLNRSNFKNMKNDLNQDLSKNKRIITPLEPKRVPSVVPGLEGLAALAADDCQAPAPEIAIPEAEFVEALPLPELLVEALPFGEVRPIDAPSETEPEIFSCEVGGNAWEQFALPVAVEPIALDGEDLLAEETWDATTAGELPELVTCEIFPTEIPDEWLRPIYVGEIPEDFFVTVFEGEGGSDTGVNTGDEVADGEGAPFDFESGFEICVLPVPEEFAAEMDPREYLVRYDAFLSENPDWGALDPDVMEAQVITASNYLSELEFGTPSKAAAFDSWYVTQVVGNALPDANAQDDNVEADPAEDSQPFDPRELLPRYDAFLVENPTWIDVNQGGDIQLQVITPSGCFPELEFGNPGEATAFDNWYTSCYAGLANADGISTSTSGTLLVNFHPVYLPTEIHLPGESSGDGEIVLKGDGELSWLDRGAINGDIQPNWRSGGEAPEFAYSSASSAPGGPGLVLGGGTLATGGLSGGAVVTGGEVMNLAGDHGHGSASESGAGTLSGPELSLEGRAENFAANTVVTGGELSLSGDVTVDSFEGNTVALSNGSSVVLQGGQVVSGETVYAFNPELAGERGYAGDLPAEILVPDALGTEASSLFGNAAAGLAPTPGQALIVEFGVLSPSQNAAEQMQDGRSLSVVADTTEVLPQSSPFAATEKLGELPAITAALSAAAEGDYEPHSDTPAASLDAMTDARHDSTTVAAGAVAVGGVAHGSGAAAASVRKPLPKL